MLPSNFTNFYLIKFPLLFFLDALFINNIHLMRTKLEKNAKKITWPVKSSVGRKILKYVCYIGLQEFFCFAPWLWNDSETNWTICYILAGVSWRSSAAKYLGLHYRFNDQKLGEINLFVFRASNITTIKFQ